jgi:hypothetical protein
MRKIATLILLAISVTPLALAGPPIPGPELDIRFAGSALTLLAGALLMIRARR